MESESDYPDLHPLPDSRDEEENDEYQFSKMDVDPDLKKKRLRSTDTGEECLSPPSSRRIITSPSALPRVTKPTNQQEEFKELRSYSKNRKAIISSSPLPPPRETKKEAHGDNLKVHGTVMSTSSSPSEGGDETFDTKSKPPFIILLRYQDKEKRMSILKASNILAKLDINHKLIEPYSKNTWQLTFNDRINANRCLTNSIIRDNGFISYIPGHVKQCNGVIRDIYLDMNLDELKLAI